MRGNILKGLTAGALVVGLTVATAAVLTAGPATPRAGEIVTGRVEGTAAGAVDYSVYLPPGYAASDAEYPVIYLLHGRGDTQAAWQRVAGDLDELIAAGDIQPIIAVMPDAPWNDRGNWYTDSAYTGAASSGPGVAVETALAVDLLDHIDATFRTVDDREGRAVGGYSMGGAGTLRFALAHQEDFSAGLVLSPAVYTPQPPADSSTRDYGAYGVGDALFDPARYEELSYGRAFDDLDPGQPVHLFIAVGDDEWPNPDPAEAHNDIDFESAQLYNTARRVPGVTAELRIMDGGHDWDVWQPGFREGIVDIASRLRTAPAAQWEAELFGAEGDDRAGGILEHADGSTTVVINADGAMKGHEPLGGLDIVVIRRGPDGTEQWRRTLGTAGNDRAYGVVEGPDGSVLVAGYTRGVWSSGAGGAPSDDIVVVSLAADGTPGPFLQFGDPAAADRAYGVAPDGAGGLYLTGYTSGRVGEAEPAGDKDNVVARVSGAAELLWVDQFGGAGEDKGFGAALLPGGGVAVGGIATGGLPGLEARGSGDGWVARYTASGERTWLGAVASDVNEQVSGVAALADGTVLAIGHTKGVLGDGSLGDNDIFVAAFGATARADGPTWVRQLGTSTDDRGAAIVATTGGGALAVATTYGAMGEGRGGVDVVTFSIDAAGEVSGISQFGSRERDGADEWDEANLMAAVGGSGVWLAGLTYGAPVGFSNAGAGDVFVMLLAGGDVEPSPSPSPTRTGEPSVSPEPTASASATRTPTSTASATATASRPRPGLPNTGAPIGG